jgi:hypothetical protein
LRQALLYSKDLLIVQAHEPCRPFTANGAAQIHRDSNRSNVLATALISLDQIVWQSEFLVRNVKSSQESNILPWEMLTGRGRAAAAVKEDNRARENTIYDFILSYYKRIIDISDNQGRVCSSIYVRFRQQV